MPHRPLSRPALLALFLPLAGVAQAQVITVTTSANVTDIPTDATLTDLPGPDGVVSFREALRVSDNEPGRQSVGFAIPEEDWPTLGVDDGQVLVQTGTPFSAQDVVTIDGTTQTAYSGDTYPDGHEIILQRGIALHGGGSELFGVHGSDVGLEGDGCLVHDNTGRGVITIAFATASVVCDNEADTIRITYASGNTVVRNTTTRIRITGLPSQLATGNVIGGPDPADRNYITGWGNVGEHGSVAGTTVELFYTDQTLIQNNWIGTTPDGMSIGNTASTTGIGVYEGNSNLTIRDNLIATRAHWGGGTSGAAIGWAIELSLYLGGTNIEIQGNTIGLDALGQPLLGGKVGIAVLRYAFEDPSDVRIGGPAPGEGNVIAGHEGAGVLMENAPGVPAVGRVRLSGNSIHSNGALGIDLMPNTWTFGPTPNDPMDADDGANGLQNYPELASAVSRGSETRVIGTLHSEPLGDYTLEFFASEQCDPSGFGQGQVFLGSTSVFTDPAGNAVFDASLPATAPPGWAVTSTATREPAGTTSEFSTCVPLRHRAAGRPWARSPLPAGSSGPP